MYPPKNAIIKSLGLFVEIPETLGAADVEVQLEEAVFGTLELVSKGEPVFAPVTPNSSPDAAVGVPPRWIVNTSEVIVPVVMPYHSVCVVS